MKLFFSFRGILAEMDRKRARYYEEDESTEDEVPQDGYTRSMSKWSGRKMKGAEVKYLDWFASFPAGSLPGVLGNGVPIAGTTQYKGVNYVKQGTGESERVGTVFTIWKLMYIINSYMVGQEIDTGLDPSLISLAQTPLGGRFICALDKQCNGQLATFSDVMSVSAVSTGDVTYPGQMPYCSYPNVSNSNRFEILVDEYIVLKRPPPYLYDTTTILSGDQKVIEGCVEFEGGLDIEMKLVPGELANVMSNNLVWFYVCDTGYGLNGDSEFEMSSRVYFTDY